MTTDTDKIRKKFETETVVWKDRLDRDEYGDYVCDDTHTQWMGFRAGYQHGQRDMIEAIGEPVVYQSNGQDLFVLPRNKQIKTEFRESQDWVPLYRLPEDAQK